MHIRAIPRRLLPHSVAYKRYLEEKRHGASWEDEIILKYVCVDYSAKIIVNSAGQTIKYVATLYYDCRNSFPADITFSEKDKITHNGREMTVESVGVPNSTTGIPHHYELGLV